MAANTIPVFPITPIVGIGALISVANTALNGTGTVTTLLTAGANGARIDYIRVKSTGTNVATVVRIFLNNGSDPTVATNNSLIAEQAVAAYTLSQTAASTDYVISLNINIPAGYVLTATIGTAVAAALCLTTFAANY